MDPTTWLLTYAMGPLVGALAVGLAPPIRRRMKALWVGTWRILHAPDKIDDLEQRFVAHEHTPVATPDNGGG